MKKIKMIKAAQQLDETAQKIHICLFEMANKLNISVETLTETVTQVLASFAAAAEQGKPITTLTNVDSISTFMAGVEALANALPASQNQDAKRKALSVLIGVAIGQDGKVTPSAAVIAQHGAKYPDLVSKYKQIVLAYVRSLAQQKPAGGDMVTATRTLQQRIDQAMRAAQQPTQQSLPPSGPSRAGSMPSGGSSV